MANYTAKDLYIIDLIVTIYVYNVPPLFNEGGLGDSIYHYWSFS